MKMKKKSKFIFSEFKSIIFNEIIFNEIIIINSLFIIMKVFNFINFSKECDLRFKAFKARMI